MSDDNETRDRQPEGRRPAWQSGTPRGQERVVSYESDERYWTDYLRVALPVVGLLLMLGLLFWWTNSIIGDEGPEPTATVATSASNVAVAATNTPGETVEPNLTPATVVNNPTTPDDTDGNGTETVGGDPTEEPVVCDSDFANGDLVQTSDEGAAFRSGADFDQEEPPRLPAGAQLEVSSDCFETADDADETRFRRVTTLEVAGDVGENERGFVAESLLEASEE